MSIKLITVTTDAKNQGFLALSYSANKHNWDFHPIMVQDWKGFGTKLIETYNYLKGHPEVTEFIFCDAFDVVALGTPEEFLMKKQAHYKDYEVICSAERGLWPGTLEEYRDAYEHYDHGFNFANSGSYYSNRNSFLKLFDASEVTYETDDQEWMNSQYLFDNDGEIKLDNNQVLFNSHSFIQPDEYTYNNNRVQILGNESVFIHCNGRSDMTKIYELI